MVRGQQNLAGLVIVGGIMGLAPLLLGLLYLAESQWWGVPMVLAALVGIHHNAGMYANYRRSRFASNSAGGSDE